jgi:hypothetical protein
MLLPTLSVEFAPASGALATSPTWIDITSYVLEWESSRGFSSELDTVAQAGTATIVLDNRDRRFDPTYAAGPYFGNLNPGKQVRIRVTYDSITYERFRGHIEGFPQEYPGGLFNTECVLHCVDGTQYLARAALKNNSVVSRRVRPSQVDARGVAVTENRKTLELAEYSDLIEYSEPWAYWQFRGTAALGTAYEATISDVVGGKDLLWKGAGAVTFNPLVIGESWPSTIPSFERSASNYARTAGLEIPEARNWTVEALIELDTLPSVAGSLYRIVAGPLDASGGDPLFSLQISTGNELQAFVRLSDNTTHIRTLTGAMTTGTTYHVVLRYDAATPQLTVRRDNSEAFATPATANLALDAVGAGLNIFVGGQPNHGTPGYFDGKIDEVAIYNRHLTSTTLAARVTAYPLGFVTDQTTATRIGAILDAVSWPASWRDINTGTSQTLAGRRYANQSALDEIQVSEAANFGRFWIAPDGNATSYERAWRTHADFSTSAATFGDGTGEMPYADIGALERDDSNLYNRVTAKAATAEDVQMSEDSTSQTNYGVRNLDLGELILNTSASASSLCSELVTRYKDPQPRFREIVVRPQMDEVNLWPKVLGYDLCKHITIKKRPRGSTDTAITQASHIERIADRVPRGGFQASMSDWTTTWTVSPR